MQIAEAEREKYATIWSMPGYETFSPGEDNAERFLSVLKPAPGATVLDAGCGAGKGGLALSAAGLDVWFLDITPAGLESGRGVPIDRFIEQPLWKSIGRPVQLWGPIDSSSPRWDAAQWDYGFCCDVMEHLPTEYAMLAARNIVDACRTTWFQIAFFHDGWGAAINDDLHLTVKPFAWWLDRLKTIGDVVDARDLCGQGIFVVTEQGR